MMQHVFSSGEILYQQNVRELGEGKFTAEIIIYEGIAHNTEFTCLGTLNDRKARVRFQLDKIGEERVLSKKNINILMQSDILQSKWESYVLDWLD